MSLQALRRQPMTVYGDGKQTRSFQYVSDLVSTEQSYYAFWCVNCDRYLRIFCAVVPYCNFTWQHSLLQLHILRINTKCTELCYASFYHKVFLLFSPRFIVIDCQQQFSRGTRELAIHIVATYLQFGERIFCD